MICKFLALNKLRQDELDIRTEIFNIQAKQQSLAKWETGRALELAAALKFKKTENLKFLNTALKLNDTICSEFKNMVKEDYNKLFIQSIR